MEKLAENLQRVNEDDLLLVVQMIHDNKTPDSWTKNDVERKLYEYELNAELEFDHCYRRRIPGRSVHPAG